MCGCLWVHAAHLELNTQLYLAFSLRAHLEQGVASATRRVFNEHHILLLNKSVEFTLSSKPKQSPGDELLGKSINFELSCCVLIKKVCFKKKNNNNQMKRLLKGIFM